MWVGCGGEDGGQERLCTFVWIKEKKVDQTVEVHSRGDSAADSSLLSIFACLKPAGECSAFLSTYFLHPPLLFSHSRTCPFCFHCSSISSVLPLASVPHLLSALIRRRQDASAARLRIALQKATSVPSAFFQPRVIS